MAEALAWRSLARGALGQVTLLRKHTVRPCIGCGHCRQTGACVYDALDQARALLDRIQAAPALIVVAPVYFYGPPAQFKALIDRSQAVWERQGCRFAETRRPAYAVIAAARTGGERLFEASQLILRCFLDVMGFRLEDSLLMRGLDGPEDFRTNEAAQATLTAWSREQPGW